MSLRHAVLGLLAEGPASGWDLMQKFDLALTDVWPATQSQVYGELNKLAAAGLLEVVAEGPRGRKEYAITGEGRAELRRWLMETPPRNRRNEVLLRVFFLNAVETGQAREFLARWTETAAEEHERLRKLDDQVDWGDDALSVYGRLALEWGLRFTQMHREWAEWALERLPEK
ncbi:MULTISPECIES: PadR family transcriptional regulator [Amycolatopsis]|uniref:DNA-binding transcriptional regulator, PadR family n=2 Tax=Amycolatopsis TaxID=1813 RepID=A0A1I3W1Y5_9PSEU|nr:PadR family transcriptional regulator [Amycolatopsis sacchari]SFK00647.1 DNA-binding transcriptional regulator, PadR family [Amycolatopsis sacchari]